MIIIDEARGLVSCVEASERHEYALDSSEGFDLVARAYLRAGWDAKYAYSFTWLGRPIVQLPDDIVRMQEIVWDVRPDLIIETGVAHGGSLVLYASLCRLIGRGRVVGVDVEIRPHNRKAIEAHALADLITLEEADSVRPDTVARVAARIRPGDRVLVILDSCHTRDHVRAELEAYGPLVSEGSYIIAMDGIMESVCGAPRTQPDWVWNNPRRAAAEFVAAHPAFEIVEPPIPFNEGFVRRSVSYSRGGFIRRTHAQVSSARDAEGHTEGREPQG